MGKTMWKYLFVNLARAPCRCFGNSRPEIFFAPETDGINDREDDHEKDLGRTDFFSNYGIFNFSYGDYLDRHL